MRILTWYPTPEDYLQEIKGQGIPDMINNQIINEKKIIAAKTFMKWLQGFRDFFNLFTIRNKIFTVVEHSTVQ